LTPLNIKACKYCCIDRTISWSSHVHNRLSTSKNVSRHGFIDMKLPNDNCLMQPHGTYNVVFVAFIIKGCTYLLNCKQLGCKFSHKSCGVDLLHQHNNKCVSTFASTGWFKIENRNCAGMVVLRTQITVIFANDFFNIKGGKNWCIGKTVVRWSYHVCNCLSRALIMKGCK
jgi:hypothetical protein